MISDGGRDMMAWCAAGCPLDDPQASPESPATTDSSVTAANEAAYLPDGCAGALDDPDGGPYLPWGPYLAADNVRRLRAELALAEGWEYERYDEIVSRARNRPLADLLDNVAHFHARVIERRAEAEARAVLAARSWRLEGLEDRRGTP